MTKIPTLHEVSWKHYKETYKSPHIDKSTFRAVVRCFCKHLTEPLTNGEEVKLPFLGSISYYKQKSLRKQVDWKATKEAGEIVKYANFDTDGYLLKLVWDRGHINHRRLLGTYNIKSSSSLRRTLSAKIQEKPSRYKNFLTKKNDLQVHRYKTGRI